MMEKSLLLTILALLSIMQVKADVIINSENFPDENFRNYLLYQNYGKDGVITETEISGITVIDVMYKKISSLKGIEHFTALERLTCSSNNLTSLDLSKNTALKELYCEDNQISALDLSNNTALVATYCYLNKLTTLDLSKNSSLNLLNCSYNKLTTLNLSNNTMILWLCCSANRLKELDLSNNTMLQFLSCYENHIKDSAMDALINSLPTVISSMGELDVIGNNSEGNVMTKDQVTAAKAKGWKPKYYDGSYWQDYVGHESTGVKSLSSDSHPVGKRVYYDQKGLRLNKLQKGIILIHTSDGVTRKYYIK